jgi:predicted ATPase
MRKLAAQFLSLAEKQGATVPLILGHRIMGTTLMHTGEIARSLPLFDRAIELYDPLAHRPLATRFFGQDLRMSARCYRSLAGWLLGYPQAALVHADQALQDAREVGQAATLIYALGHALLPHTWCGNYARASVIIDELTTATGEQEAMFWKAIALASRGCIFGLTGKASDAIQAITGAVAQSRSTGSRVWLPWHLSHLATAHADIDHFDDAWRCIDEAMRTVEATKETWCEAEVNRVAGEIALKWPEPDAVKAETYFERALAVAREQQAKSWELRAAMSMAQLWRDQGKRDEARELLAPVYGWFTEGLDTRDLMDAKALLEELSS